MLLDDIGAVLRDLIPVHHVPPAQKIRDTATSETREASFLKHSLKIIKKRQLTSWKRIQVDGSDTLGNTHAPRHPIREWET